MAATWVLAAQPVPHRVNFYSLAQEVQIGRSDAELMAKSVTIFRTPDGNEYLDALGHELASFAGGEPFPYSFAVFRGDLPHLQLAYFFQSGSNESVECLAVGGGPVFIPADLIAKLDNEAELAAVLAHAIAHIAFRHPSRMATRVEIANLATVGLPGAQLPNRNIAPVGLRTFQRGFEDDADQAAVSILAKAGFDPSALASYLGKLPPDAGPQLRIQRVEAQTRTLTPTTRRADSGRFTDWKRAVAAQ